ncbi:MAG: F0F1 ATP synthase subunit delta [Alphaproteobacteria bacterium]|nr:F0F1 ATP synthase subunit delta [Alphaproteobacteria bacterium]MDE2630818.1 F0F1 ATP synthase subunit delta [Alphaproteobacteria bacterium]
MLGLPDALRQSPANGARLADEAHMSGIAGRYALAVFELALEERALDSVERDFNALKAMIAQTSDLARFVRAPVFSRSEQAKGMAAILDKMGAAPLTTRFVLLLAAKRRLYLLLDAIRDFEALLARQRGEIDAEIASARPLRLDETAELKRVLRAKFGRDPQIAARVDPTLLGGLVVKVGSRMIDSSLRAKLNGIRAVMRGA